LWVRIPPGAPPFAPYGSAWRSHKNRTTFFMSPLDVISFFIISC
jgi:hypothetical protein